MSPAFTALRLVDGWGETADAAYAAPRDFLFTAADKVQPQPQLTKELIRTGVSPITDETYRFLVPAQARADLSAPRRVVLTWLPRPKGVCDSFRGRRPRSTRKGVLQLQGCGGGPPLLVG